MITGPILINGAGGFLGSHTVEAFLEAGRDVIASDLPGVDLSWAKALGARVRHADLREFEEARRAVRDVAGVVNVVGVFDFARTYAELYAGNVTATEHMCRAALEARVDKFVHIASVAVYGFPAYTPIAEAGPKRPKNAYEKTKKLGEDVVIRYQRTLGLPATSLRPGPIYGPRSRYVHSLMFAANILLGHAASRRSALGKRSSGVLNFTDGALCHHVHVRDVARASVLLMDLPRTIGCAYNCVDRRPIKWNELLDAIAALTGFSAGRRVPWVPVLAPALVRTAKWLTPARQLSRLNENLRRGWDRLVATHDLEPALCPRVERDMFDYLLKDHVYDTSQLASLGFEWEFPDIFDGLASTWDWLVDNRWVPPR